MENKIRELSNANRRKRLLKRVVAFLSIVVLLFTVNSLKLTAITLSRVPACGLKKHIHKAKCYDGNGNLICGKVEHQHTDACYQVAPNDLTLEIEGDGVAVDEPSLDLSLSLDDGVLQVDDRALQLDDSLLELDNPPVDDAGSGAQTNTSQKPTYELGEKAKLSKIIKKTKLEVSIDEVNEVGVVDYDGTQASLLSIEKTDEDYIIAAAMDFDEADLAIIAEKGIEVVRLVGGRMPAEVVEQTDPQTPSEVAEQGDVQTDVQATEETDPQIDVQTDLQAGAESTEDEISSDIVVDDQVAVDEFNGGESDALALDLDDAVVVQQQGEEAPVEEQGREAPAEEQGGEAPAEEQGGEAPAEEQGGEAPVAEQGGEAHVEEQGGEAPVEDQGGIIVTEAEVPADEQGEETPAEEQVCEVEIPADVQGEEPPADAQDEETPAEEQAGDVEAPADTQADEEEQSIQQSDMDEVAVEVQDGGIEVEAPADVQGDVEAPVDVQGVETPVEEQGGVEAPVDVQGDDDEALAEEQGVEGPVDMQGVEASADVQGVETPADVQGDDDKALAEEQGVEAPADTQSDEEDQSVQQSDQVEALVEEQADEQADEVEQSVQQSDMDEVAADTQVEEEEQADEEETLTDVADEAPAEEEDQADEEEQAAEEENASEEDVEAEEEQPAEEENASEVDEEAVDGEEQAAEEEQGDEATEEEQGDEATEEEQGDEATEEEQGDEAAEEELSGEAPAAAIYSATIDLSEVETYPISLMEIMAKAVPSDAEEDQPEAIDDAAAADEEAEATVETAEEAAAEEEVEAAPEASAWTIEFDTSLFSIEAVEDDYLITPIQSFERTQIIVTNDSRYELTLVNCVLADESKDETVEQEAAFVYVATIDLTDVEAYPLSLNEMMSAARAEQPDEEQAQEQAQDAQPDETEEQTQDEQPALNIEYDENLLSIEIVGDDHLITPVQSFERTVITVESDGRYELTLVNCALTEVVEAGEAEAFPAQDFEGQTDYIRVVASAPAGAFPVGTTMKVVDVADEKTLTDIEDTVSEEFVEVRSVHAVDITFTDVDGNEIEPLTPISVVMSLVESEQIQKAETVVVHVDDEGAAQVVESESAGEAVVSIQTGDGAQLPDGEGEAIEEDAAASQDAVTPQSVAESEAFQADSFSIYAMVQTEAIETRYIAADGTTWNISVGYGKEAEIPAGASLAVSEVVGEDAEAYLAQTAEALRGKETITLARFFDITILDSEGQEVQPKATVEVHASLTAGTQDTVKAVHFAEEGPEIIEASQDDETVVFEAEGFSVYGIVYTVDFHYGVDGETYEFTLPGGGAVGMRELAPALGLVEDDADAVGLFVESIEGIAFSDEELVKPVPVNMNMTVGALKQRYGLESEVSAELTEAQVAELNDKVLQAPDWALVSLKPFDTEETLTITMKNGEAITVAVTDAQLSREVITASGETYVITVTYGEDALIPDGAELKVREILPVDDEYAGYLAKAQRAVSGEASADEAAEDADAGEEAAEANGAADYARFFDIEIRADEQKVEPAALVTVDIALADAPQSGEELKVVHFDEADGPVVMQTEAGETVEDEAAETAKVRFETDGFSVYGVIVSPHTPTGVYDLDGRMCTISHTMNNTTNYVTATVLDEATDKLEKTSDQSQAAVWQFESAGTAGNYYISTLVDGVKKYMHLDCKDNNNAHGALSDAPQQFTVSDAGDGLYRIKTSSDGHDYYLNEFNGGQGFAGWYQESSAYDRMALNFSPAMKNVEQYMLVTKYDNEYYIVLNDGTLEKVEDGLSGNPAGGDFTTPMTWTWDGSHLFHNSLATGYTDDQRASDYYRRYIDPQSGTGLTQEYGKYTDGTNVEGAPTENPIVLVTVNGNKGKYTYKTITDRTNAMLSTAFDITASGDSFKIHKNTQYLGVVRDEDGNLHITGQQGTGAAADFWFADATNLTAGKSYVMMELVDYPQNGEQYFVLIKNSNGDYFIVNPDRSISQKHVANWEKSYTFAITDKMQLWTYSNPDDSGQLFCTYNGQTLYLNPYNASGITNSKASSGTGWGLYIDHSDNENGNHQVRGYGPLFFNIDNNILNGNKGSGQRDLVYLARVTGASEMYYGDNGFEAERNHMVNHIDISIEGKTEVDVPLIYGTYLYRNPNQDDPSAADYYKTFTVTKSTDMTLAQKVKITEDDIKQGTVEAFVRRKDASGNEYYDYRPDLFTITGYSANEKTEYSTDQVRIEGNFKVADIPPVQDSERDSATTRKNRYDNRVYYTVSVNKPVTFQYIDPNMGQIYIYGDDGQIVPLEVTMDINFSASFNYWDWNGVGAQHNNECPPIQPPKPDIHSDATDKEKAQKWGEFWAGNQFYKWHGNDAQTPRASLDLNDSSARQIYRKTGPNGWDWDYSFSTDGGYQAYTINERHIGGIAGWGNSGMDFVLGGDAGDAEANVVALNITKMIVDEQGDPISLAQPVDNDFKVFYNSSGDPCAVDGKAWRVGEEGDVTNPVADTDAIYSDYNYLHTKSIRVGASGMGLIYDYSVQPGMFYIQEDKDKLAQTVLDTKGQTWEYAKTYIETEYVWRNASDTDEKRHVSQTYTNRTGEYKSVPEVLGPYHRKVDGKDVITDDEDKPLRNGFLVYYVYNVYRSKPINVQVEKKWQYGDETTDPLSDASMTVTLGRYRLTKDPNYTPGGALNIVDSCTGIDNSAYNATYTVLGPNGYTHTVRYSSSGMTLTGLWAGEYTVVKIVPVKDNYLIDPLQETRFVTVPSKGAGTATFTATNYQQVGSQDDIIKVGVAVGYPDGAFRVNPNPYNTKFVMAVPKNSTVQFSYDDFLYSDWGMQTDVKWAIYQWDESNPNDIAWKTTDSLQELPAPHGQLQTVSVGDKDICILILFHDENIAPAMNIRLKGAAANVQSNAMFMPGGRKLAGIAPDMSQDDTQGTPVSPVEGMMYVRDQVNGEDWSATVELSEELGWNRMFSHERTPIDFEEYDPDGYKYVYFIANVTEHNIPNGTQIQFSRDYTRELIEGGVGVPDKVKYTFTVTNRMPDKTKVKIRKVSELDENTLLNATFDLYKGDSKIQEVVVTNGYSQEIEVGRGHYKLVETQTPSGYIKTGDDPEFDVSANANGEIVVTYKNSILSDNIITVQNKPKGALKITKAVTVNDADDSSDLTNGIYSFSVEGNDSATSDEHHTVSITFANGRAIKWMVDNGEEKTVAGTDNQWSVVVPDLIPGAYTITETSSGNMTLKSVTGGTGNGNTANGTISATVMAGDTTPTTAAAQVVYTNNRDVVDIDATKTWKDDKGEQINHIVNDASVTFELQKKVGDVWSKVELEGLTNPQTLAVTNAANADAWKAEWHSLPKYDGSVLIQYRVVETAATFMDANVKPVTDPVAGITIEANTRSVTVNIDNTLPTTDISVTKLWKDGTVANEDRVFSEAKQINFTLYQKLGIAEGQPYKENNVAIVGQVTYTPAANGNPASWSTWPRSNLPRFVYDETSQAWTAASYYVVEDVLNGVKVTYQKGNDTAVEKAENAMVTEADDHRTVTIINEDIPVDLNILKVDANDMTKPLAGAQFELCCVDETNASIQTETKKQAGPTGLDGKTAFTGLVSGYYMVEETVVPEGYILTSSRRFYIKVDIGATTDQIQLVDWNSAQQKWAPRAADQKLAFEAETSTVKVGNEPGASLPATGGPGTTLYYAAGAALMLLAIATLIFRKKADDE